MSNTRHWLIRSAAVALTVLGLSLGKDLMLPPPLAAQSCPGGPDRCGTDLSCLFVGIFLKCKITPIFKDEIQEEWCADEDRLAICEWDGYV